MRQQRVLSLLSIAVTLSPVSGFYLPGVAPVEYADGSPVSLKVNKLTSAKTQLPFRYYVLPVCQPKVVQQKAENLGEILMGDAIESSDYDLQMNKNTLCNRLCEVTLDEKQKDQFRSFIGDQYMVNWIIDNMPSATRYKSEQGQDLVQNGFPIGYEKAGRFYIHNHFQLKVKYHRNAETYVGSRIVGFEVTPESRKDCREDQGAMEVDGKGPVKYTYDVTWTFSETRWASRWDSYLEMKTSARVHWFPILNSLAVMTLLSGLVAMILLRTLHRDIAAYNEAVTKEEQEEETGWKLVHGDVFRIPSSPLLLCCCVGSGCQLLGMSLVTVIIACLGFLSPSYRGGLLQSMILLYAVMGMVAGFVAVRFYKLFNCENWRSVVLITAFFFPTIVFAVFFMLNLMIWEQASSGAVPMVTMFMLLLLWFGLSVPLVFFGGHLGFQKDAIEVPCRINSIARVVPETHLVNSFWVSILVAGLLPFGAVYTELFFLMTSLWQHQFYYLFGFLILTLVILVVTCSEVSIAITYFGLTVENHRWWWRAFFSSATSGVYVFGYSVVYFYTRLQIEKIIPTLLYFGYMAIFSFTFSLLTGAIGFVASFLFVKGIYGSIKVD